MRSRRTIMKHCKVNQAYLIRLRQPGAGAEQGTIELVEDCQKALIVLLDTLKEADEDLSMGGECRSPYP
jgi:hypothetical protein